MKLSWVGATGQAVTSDVAQSLGLPRPGGLLVKDIYPGGPLANAGVKSGEVVLSVDGVQVDDMQSLNYRIATHKPGDSVKMHIEAARPRAMSRWRWRCRRKIRRASCRPLPAAIP